MKNTFWAAGILSVSLFAARMGHATDGWIQIPGGATQIAVGANDMPWVRDPNGGVWYLAPPAPACGNGICVDYARQWTLTDVTAAVIASDQFGYLWRTDAVGGLAITQPSSKAFDTTLLQIGVAAAITSLAPGRMQPYSEWNYPFGVASGVHQLVAARGSNVSPVAVLPYTTTYATASGSPAVVSLDFTENQQWINTGYYAYKNQWVTTNGWQQLDTGELQVAQFTVDGSATQVPWIIVHGSEGREAFSIPSVADPWHYVGVPKVSGHNYDIDWMTDHYVAASRGTDSGVWHWTGNANGSGGAWSKLANSNSVPSGGKIVQVAYASALPGTNVGTIGPSHLYMIDEYNNIYQWGDIQGPVK